MKKESYKKFTGDIPVLSVRGNGIAEAWENSVVELYNNGGWYARQGPKDKGQMHVDSTMTVTVKNPDSPLFFHRYTQYGFGDLLEYELEVLGAKDVLVHDPNFDPEGDTRWEYHYSERLMKYPGLGGAIDQLDEMVKGLSNEPWNRRNQGITWVPEKDIGSKNPPCLQRIWAYIAPVGDGTGEVEKFKLNMNYHFRSRNVMIAAPMNMKGMHVIQSYLRDEVIENTGMNLVNGRLVDMIDAYHVSAQDQPTLNGFMKRLQKSKENGESIEDRVFSGDMAYEQYEAARPDIEKKVISMVRDRLEERGQLNLLEKETRKIKQLSEMRSKTFAREMNGN